MMVRMQSGNARVAIVGVSAFWITIALAIDRYWLRDAVPWFSRMLYFKDTTIVLEPYSRTFGWIGLTLVLVLPSVCVGCVLSLWLRARKRISISQSVAIFGITALWLLLVPVFIWAGHNIYQVMHVLLSKWDVAKGAMAVVDGVTFKGSLYLYDFRCWTIDSGLGAMVGLAFGVVCLYKRGLWDVVREHIEL